MANYSIAGIRLYTQHIIPPKCNTPADVVSWFGAIQAQDFAAAKWAIGLRTKAQTDATIQGAFDNGLLLRTHIMRPTWHFVTPADIRWILALTSQRTHAFNGYYYRRSGFDKTIFRKSNQIIQKALEDGKQLTRTELNYELQKAKVPTQDVGLSYALMQAELDGIICSGPRRGKQFTYMLLDERVPYKKTISRDEALGELVTRYFQSHGPAQIQDFVWWSGLTVTDATRGIAIAGLQKKITDGKVYWVTSRREHPTDTSIFLLPPFDEYFVAYKDRDAIFDERYRKEMNFGGGMIRGSIISQGVIIGSWRRIFEKGKISITLYPFTTLTKEELAGAEKAAAQYGKFHDMLVSVHCSKMISQ